MEIAKHNWKIAQTYTSVYNIQNLRCIKLLYIAQYSYDPNPPFLHQPSQMQQEEPEEQQEQVQGPPEKSQQAISEKIS